ncbi:uncharacterized protein AB675_7317 [Cyphellophora attinorum]|uniref:DUF3752 domain-containing protein n=1 Tax=Cyphellophora attinorum TaxID=1664694 RepID=A0A0N1HJ14_9EURO|nr:uncharacterized protein AB675_7317 [Phialophora attinorum]KPI36285.1 hypothetical protein AB675_7317 [Phialophora attinorum]
MPSVGPQLPPHLAEKRRRNSDQPSDDRRPASPESATKRRRVAGPSLPPAPLDERPAEPLEKVDGSDDESSSDDDDFGPALPTAADLNKPTSIHKPTKTSSAAPAMKRDDWMTMAPSSGDWSSRGADPTQLKARKFNTGKGAKAPSTSGDRAADASWHETPEQKQERLQRELMGIKSKDVASKAAPANVSQRSEEEEATAKRLREYNAERGPSLYDSHQSKKGREEEDDPSARAFDREKDIAGGLQINATKRRDMLNKASDFGSRFSSAKYL